MTAVQLQIDHVIAVVDDLGEAGERLLADHGLASLPGGRHPGHGTGNRIVPFGESYLELMAVVDPLEAQASRLGRWADAHAGSELAAAAVCLRTDDIDSIAAMLGETPLAMSRQTPDGSTLSWRLVGLDGMVGHGWPFFIQWVTGTHPGRSPAPHRITPVGFGSVALPPTSPEVREVLTEVDGIALDAERIAVVITTEEGDIVI